MAAFDCWLRKMLLHQRISAQRFLAEEDDQDYFLQRFKAELQDWTGRASFALTIGAWLLGKCSPLSDRCGCFICHRDFGDQT